jgi:hypothetical protein
MKSNRYTIIAILLACAWTATTSALPLHDPVPGGIALVPLKEDHDLTFQGRRVMVAQAENGYVAIVGIPLSEKPGQSFLKSATAKIFFEIRPKQYEEQHLTIQNKRKVNPLPNDMQRINRDLSEMNAAFDLFSQLGTIETTFKLPTIGPVSSPSD